MAKSTKHTKDGTIATSLAPWLSVQDCIKAMDFYKSAFGAVETYRHESPDGGLVIKLSVNGAEFWLSGGITKETNSKREVLGGDSVRMILTVADPDAVFQMALNAGAKEIFPVVEDYGWRLGRIVDPFGLHWEIGHPL